MSKDIWFDENGKFIKRGKRSLMDRFKFDVTDLIRAIDKNDVDMVHRILSAGIDPNQDDGIERFALPIAVDGNNVNIIRLLLQKKANPNVLGKDGESALYKAVNWENSPIVKHLLEAGADPNFENNDGSTAAQLSTKSGFGSLSDFAKKAEAVEKANQLATEKANQKSKEENAKTAKIEAENAKKETLRKENILKARRKERQKKSIIKPLIIKATKEKTPSIKENNVEPKKKIDPKENNVTTEIQNKKTINLKAKYNVKNDNYFPALLQAIQAKDSKAVHVFIDKVDDLNAFDSSLKTSPLLSAMSLENSKLVLFLISKGADPFKIIPEKNQSIIAMAISLGMYDLVNQILAQKGDQLPAYLNDPSQSKSLQYYAVADPKIFHLLLQKGADPSFGGKDVPSPIEMAISSGTIAILPTLAANEIDLNKRLHGKTPLEWAIYYDKESWVIGLIEEGANVDTLNKNGETLLMSAARDNNSKFTIILLNENADTTLVNGEGKTALDVAKDLGNREEIVQLLR